MLRVVLLNSVLFHWPPLLALPLFRWCYPLSIFDSFFSFIPLVQLSHPHHLHKSSSLYRPRNDLVRVFHLFLSISFLNSCPCQYYFLIIIIASHQNFYRASEITLNPYISRMFVTGCPDEPTAP